MIHGRIAMEVCCLRSAAGQGTACTVRVYRESCSGNGSKRIKNGRQRANVFYGDAAWSMHTWCLVSRPVLPPSDVELKPHHQPTDGSPTAAFRETSSSDFPSGSVCRVTCATCCCCLPDAAAVAAAAQNGTQRSPRRLALRTVHVLDGHGAKSVEDRQLSVYCWFGSILVGSVKSLQAAHLPLLRLHAL